MGVQVADMVLSERAAMMRESLQQSQSFTDNMVSILGSFDHRLSALETAMRPTQVLSFLTLFYYLCLIWFSSQITNWIYFVNFFFVFQ